MSTQYFSPDDDWDDPFGIDTTVAHPARRYDYFLGGKDNAAPQDRPSAADTTAYAAIARVP